MVRIQWYLYLFSGSLVETRRQPLRNNKALLLIQSAPRNQSYCNHRATLTLDASNEAVKGVKVCILLEHRFELNCLQGLLPSLGIRHAFS